jgi:hypothetical protein
MLGRDHADDELLARFDASLAELLLPSDWTYKSSRLYPDQQVGHAKDCNRGND